MGWWEQPCITQDCGYEFIAHRYFAVDSHPAKRHGHELARPVKPRACRSASFVRAAIRI
jgi:hypothetical protein